MNKEDKARFLFEEFGNIDDELLYESSGKPLALIKTKKKKRRLTFFLAAALAATISVVTTTTIVSANLTSKPQDGDSRPAETQSNASEAQEPQDISFEAKEFAQTIVSGRPAIFYDDGETIRTKKLTVSEYNTLMTLTKNGSVPVENGRKAKHRVWITDGQGRVCSPLLRYADGNIDSKLFSYEQELALTADLEQKLEAITGVDF